MENNEIREIRNRERRARRRLARQGLLLRKSRSRTGGYVFANGAYQGYDIYDHGGYMIVDAGTDRICGGEHFDLDLDTVEKWAKED